MDDKLRKQLHLRLRVKLGLLPRSVKHDFWRQSRAQNEHATKTLVDTILAAVDEEVDVVEKGGLHYRR
jgi:hypothetical protein